MKITRTIATALCGIALAASACSGGGDEPVAQTQDQQAPQVQQVRHDDQAAQTDQPDTPTEVSVEETAGDPFARLDELNQEFEAATTVEGALDAMARLVEFIESDPTLAGGTWEFTEADMAPYAERYGVTVAELTAAVRAHPVLGEILAQATVVPGTSAAPDETNTLSADTDDSAESELEDDGWNDSDRDDSDGDDDMFEPVFLDEDLAASHTGPWGDHALARCLDSERTVEPLYSWFSNGGSTENGALVDASVSVAAVFGSETEARIAFEQIDLCHIGATYSQFLEALGFVGASVSGVGYQTHEIDRSMQVYTSHHMDGEWPVALVAVQDGDTVVIALTFGSGPGAAMVEAVALMG